MSDNKESEEYFKRENDRHRLAEEWLKTQPSNGKIIFWCILGPILLLLSPIILGSLFIIVPIIFAVLAVLVVGYLIFLRLAHPDVLAEIWQSIKDKIKKWTTEEPDSTYVANTWDEEKLDPDAAWKNWNHRKRNSTD
jgi:uncharacterized membrane protein YraQ (UPF0718 family)